MKKGSVVTIDPGIMSGAPCFSGTRVPVRTLIDYIEGGDTLDAFLEQFPTVSRRLAVAYLEDSTALLSCVPKDLAQYFPGHQVKTVPQAGWASISNGKLLRLIAESGSYDLFVTVDKNLPNQNRVSELPFAIAVLRAKTNRLKDVLPFGDLLIRRLTEFRGGQAYLISLPE
jgi:uncharacterized protein (DUF433 family)